MQRLSFFSFSSFRHLRNWIDEDNLKFREKKKEHNGNLVEVNKKVVGGPVCAFYFLFPAKAF